MSFEKFHNEEGASAVEYGLLVAAIAAVIAGIVLTLGTRVDTAFTNTDACIDGNAATACP